MAERKTPGAVTKPADSEWQTVSGTTAGGDWQTVSGPEPTFGERFMTRLGEDVVNLGAPFTNPKETAMGLLDLIHPYRMAVKMTRNALGQGIPENLADVSFNVGMAGIGEGLGAAGGKVAEHISELPVAKRAKLGVGLIFRPGHTLADLALDALTRPVEADTPYQPFRPNPAIRSKTSFGGPADPGYSAPNPMPRAQPGRLALPEEPAPTQREPFRPNPRIAAKTRFGGSTSPEYSTPKPAPKIRSTRAQVPEVPGTSPAPTPSSDVPSFHDAQVLANAFRTKLSDGSRVTAAEVSKLSDEQWQNLSNRLGVDVPSAATRTETLKELRRLEHAGKAEGAKKRSARSAKSSE